MLTVTDNAKQHLKKVLKAHTTDSDLGVRLTKGTGGQLELKIDEESPGDHVVEHEGAKVLLIEQELAPVAEGITLDTKNTPDGPELVISKSKR